MHDGDAVTPYIYDATGTKFDYENVILTNIHYSGGRV